MSKQVKYWEFKNKVPTSLGQNEADLYLYIEIASWGGGCMAHSAQSFKAELDALGDIDVLNVYVNSPGGDFFEALAIMNMLKRAKCKVNVNIDALAASAATIVCMAGDKVVMPANTMMMIHRAMTAASGNTDDMQEAITVLEKCNQLIKQSYLDKAGDKLDDETITTIMSKDSWLTAQECYDYGLCDEILPAKQVAAKFDSNILNRYKDVPESIKAMVKNQPTEMPVVENIITNLEEVEVMNLEELKAKHPDIYNQVIAEGIKAERERIKNIEDLAIPGNEEIINKAKFDTGITVEAVAVEIIKAQKTKGQTFMNAMEQDAETSNVALVTNQALPQNHESAKEKKVSRLTAALNSDKRRVN